MSFSCCTYQVLVVFDHHDCAITINSVVVCGCLSMWVHVCVYVCTHYHAVLSSVPAGKHQLGL